MVRELFEMARSKKACIIFFDDVDAIGLARFDDGAGCDNEVQRTMLELINQLDGFDARGNIKVIMATNRYVMAKILRIALSKASPVISVRHTSVRFPGDISLILADLTPLILRSFVLVD